MRTTTARIFEEDLERARVIGALRQLNAPEILHVALNEYVINHRAELAGLFTAVQSAILSGDSAGLREAFAIDVPQSAHGVDADARRAEERWTAGPTE